MAVFRPFGALRASFAGGSIEKAASAAFGSIEKAASAAFGNNTSNNNMIIIFIGQRSWPHRSFAAQ